MKIGAVDTPSILLEIEIELKKHKIIAHDDYTVLTLMSDGTGLLLCRSVKKGILKETKLTEYESLGHFYLWASQLINKEIHWKDQSDLKEASSQSSLKV